MATESIIVSVKDKKFSFESQVSSIGNYRTVAKQNS